MRRKDYCRSQQEPKEQPQCEATFIFAFALGLLAGVMVSMAIYLAYHPGFLAR